MTACYLVTMTCVLCWSLVGGTTVYHMNKLHTHLLQDYNNNIRPVKNYKNAVRVNSTFRFVSLQNLDDLSGVVKFLSYTELSWKDERLNWNVSQFSGITKVSLRVDDVWKPELVMINSPDQKSLPGQNARFVTINSRGVATLASVDLLHTTCSVDVTKYPFDTQICEIVIVPWGYSAAEVLFLRSVDNTHNEVSNAGPKPSLREHAAWKTDSTKLYIKTNDHYSSLIIELSFTRRHLYAIANLILPVFILGLLNIWVFWLPPESGERTSYSITAFLSFAVYMSILNDNMPKGSEPLALVNYEMFVFMLYSSSILGCTIISLRMYNNVNKKEVPKYLMKIVRRLRCTRQGCSTSDKRIRPINEDGRMIDGPVSHINMSGRELRPQPKKSDLARMMTRLAKAEEEKEPEPEITWADVGELFDNLMCLIHFVWWSIQVIVHFVIIL